MASHFALWSFFRATHGLPTYGPQCTVDVLAGTHWGDELIQGDEPPKRQPFVVVSCRWSPLGHWLRPLDIHPNCCSRHHSLNLSLIVITCHELANAISGICHREEPSHCACLTPIACMLDIRLCVHIHEISLFVTYLLRSTLGTTRHHNHRGNTLFCICFRYNTSHQIPLIWSQLPRNSNTRCTETRDRISRVPSSSHFSFLSSHHPA